MIILFGLSDIVGQSFIVFLLLSFSFWLVLRMTWFIIEDINDNDLTIKTKTWKKKSLN